MKNEKKGTRSLALISFCLVFLCNPNITIIDLLPDFIACFILAGMLEKAADSAPFFDEVRTGLIRLGWISAARIPAFLLLTFIRSHNTADNDIFPMLSLIFAALELIVLIPLIKNLFSALYYLGERGGATALIKPFGISKKSTMRPEDLQGFTLFFVILKCVLYVLPDLLLLSATTDAGIIQRSPLAKFYFPAILVSVILGSIIGSIWVSRCKKYAKAAGNASGENDDVSFENALAALRRVGAESQFEFKQNFRNVKFTLFLLSVSAVLTFPLSFEQTKNINVFPTVLFAAIMMLVIFRLSRFAKTKSIGVIISGVALSLLSILELTFSVLFSTSYEYLDIAYNKLAKEAFLPVQIFSVCEFVALIFFLYFAFAAIREFIIKNTAIASTSPSSEDDNGVAKISRELHREIIGKAIIHLALGILLGLAKCIDTQLIATVTPIYTSIGETVTATPVEVMPWFGIVVTAIAIAYIGYTFYFSNLLKNEWEMRHSKTQ